MSTFGIVQIVSFWKERISKYQVDFLYIYVVNPVFPETCVE